MKSLLKYSHGFNVLDIDYRIYSDSPDVIRFFRRAYCLFNKKRRTGRSRIFTLKLVSGGKRNIKKIINDANKRIHATWMDCLTNRLIFFHASSVKIKGSRLLFIGGPLSGKSSIAALLRDFGARVLNDDFTPVEYATRRVLSFPMFSNIRGGLTSDLQKRHLKPLRPYFRHFGMLRREYIEDMSGKEFKAYRLYNKELYSAVSRGGFKKKRLMGIFLKRKNKGAASLKKLDFPDSFSMFINSIHMPIPVFRKRLKSMIGLFGKMEFYTLESSSLKQAASIVRSELYKKAE